ncbi:MULTISPECIES: CU044_5270 family protein [unclassified Nonomuraea]|uniref:CU044_5270 family protein n=1 Tax=Nonomuraea sp. NPDC047529 TaxID=3155623 RepID=UPI0033FB3138
MNPMDELRAARPAHLGDRPVDERTRAAELARAMSGARRPRRRRAVVRPVWGLAALAAGATAVAVVVAGNAAPQPGGQAPQADGQVPQAGESASATPRKVTLSAREVLLAAAEKADRQPDGTGDWWYTSSVSRYVYPAVKGGYLVVDRQRNDEWTPRATGGDQWSRQQRLGAEPAGEADRLAWEQAGSPSEIDVVVPVKKVAPMRLSTASGKPATSHSSLVDGDKVFWLGRNVTMKDLRGLPDEPAKLKKWLLDSYTGHSTESSSVKMSSDDWLFAVSVGLIVDMPVTPQVRGAAFRMLAGLDSVKVIENVTDAEGRTGTAAALRANDKRTGVRESRLIFDEATGRALGTESIVVEPRGAMAVLEPGTVSSSEAVLESGWTDAGPKR